jgi:tripartite ATP-independent transporter DctP family solute receptor
MSYRDLLTRFKVSLVVLVALVLAIGAISPQPSLAAATKPVTLRIAHAVEPLMPLHAGAEKMAEIAAKKSGRTIKILVFPSAQLGSEKDVIEGVQLGSIDMAIVSSGTLARFAPMQHIAYAPYLFRDVDHFMKVYRGPIAKEMAKQLMERTGILSLDLSWYYGVRHLTTRNTPVRSPADLKGLKIRAPSIPVIRDAIKTWGCAVTTMDPSELYLALQTGVADGQENPSSSIFGWKFYEVQKYLMLTGHMMGNMSVLINGQTFEKLTPEQKKILQEATLEAGKYQNDLTLKRDEENIKKLAEMGMTVVTLDVEPFRKLSSSIIPQYEKEWGVGLYKRVQDTK